MIERISHLVLLVATLTACGSTQKPPPAPAPEPIVEAPKEEPLPHIDGDGQVPERFAKAFGEWLRDENAGGIYTRVVTVSEVSNAVSLVVERRIEMNGECRIGPSTIEIIEEAGETKAEATHFGEDCCPDTRCEMTPDSWNLRYIHAVDAKDPKALSVLFAATKKLKYELVTPDGKSKKTWSRKDIAAGKFVNPPGCGFIDTRPSCGEPDAKTGAFTCRCDGGGTHTEFNWEKEGDGFVIVSINESSS